ncbi:hypothetical protein JMJ35_005687 [Cladonia borealis]|uniref:Uncharacterized protein n=1 Tax=Cladonia borealis TaxID=184061 RepID=A0AA39QYY8_9LECA|nr:hypothetical protein JMJ35_005687 [Cladonia borealis]
MASPETKRKLPYLPPEILTKIFAEASNHRDYSEFVQLWTQCRHASSVFKSEIERTLIHQHLKKPTIHVKLMPILSALVFGPAEEAREISEYEYIDLVHSSDISLPLEFHQLSPNENEITFKYQRYRWEGEEWPDFDHLSGKVMLRPHTIFMHTTLQHLPAQTEWVNRDGKVTLSLTFDWKQLFSMFIARDARTYKKFFTSPRFFVFDPPCRGRFGDETARMCTGHGGEWDMV